MRYILTFIWTFLLINMTMYVGGSMIGADYNLQTATILSVIVTILMYIIPAILPPQPTKEQ